jgi:hypothetical protein
MIFFFQACTFTDLLFLQNVIFMSQPSPLPSTRLEHFKDRHSTPPSNTAPNAQFLVPLLPLQEFFGYIPSCVVLISFSDSLNGLGSTLTQGQTQTFFFAEFFTQCWTRYALPPHRPLWSPQTHSNHLYNSRAKLWILNSPLILTIGREEGTELPSLASTAIRPNESVIANVLANDVFNSAS